MVPRTCMSPWTDVDPSNSADRTRKVSYHNPRQPFSASPTHATSPAMPQERSLTVLLNFDHCTVDSFERLPILLP